MIVGERTTKCRWANMQTDSVQIVELLQLHTNDETWTVEKLKQFNYGLQETGRIKVLVDAENTVLGVVMFTLKKSVCCVHKLVTVSTQSNYEAVLLSSIVSLQGKLANQRIEFCLREDDTAKQLLLRKYGFQFDPAAPRVKTSDGYDLYLFWFQENTKT